MTFCLYKSCERPFLLLKNFVFTELQYVHDLFRTVDNKCFCRQLFNSKYCTTKYREKNAHIPEQII